MQQSNFITHADHKGVPIKGWFKGVQVEDKAMLQLENVASMPFVFNHIAAMADCHWGMGATVGSVIATKGAIIPAAVGVDIGCVDKDTEFLTPQGWKKISDWNNDLVMQYDPYTGNGQYVQPTAYIRKPADKFYHLKTKYGINQMLSPEHRVLYRATSRVPGAGQLQVISAQELVETHEQNVLGFSGKFLTTFKPVIETEVPLTDEEIRIMVMVMADGCFSSSGDRSARCTLRFKKIRKYERAKHLLSLAGIDYRDSSAPSNPRDYVLTFNAPIREKSLAFFWPASAAQLKIIFDEIFYWDGNYDDGVYFSRVKDAADFAHYLFSAMGYRSRLLIDYRDTGIDYRVFAILSAETGMRGTPKCAIETIECDGSDVEKFCFTVPSSYWVMRREGCIAITGNCGMMAHRTSLTASDLPDNLFGIRSAIEKAVPHGRTDNGDRNDRGARGDVPDDILRNFQPFRHELLDIAAKHPKIAKAAERASNHVGTLGTGNHFIELCLDEADRVWVMLHSGSRGIGNRIGSYFIEKAKEEMKKWFINVPDIDLAYLPEGSQYYGDYCAAVAWAQRFARLNRKTMMDYTMQAIAKEIPVFFVENEVAVNCHHNYVSWERHFGENVIVTRKGAVHAGEGVMGIIPGSMGTRSYIVRGKGNRDSFCSCSHGAGRAMSRTEARKRFTIEDHKKAVKGIECRVDDEVLDETPGAYKSIDAVMEAQTDLVDVVHTLRQVVCVKG